MPQSIEDRVRELGKRAGLGDISPRIVVAALAVLAVAVAFAAWRWWPADGEVLTPEPPVVAQGAPPGTADVATSGVAESVAGSNIWVHVVGAVRHPGLYDLPPESRVESVVAAAGGLLGNAAPEAVNLARKVADGEQVVIPTQDQVKRGTSAGPTTSGAAASVGGAASGPIDLNSATAAQLDTLPGIGPATATKIVADREANGPYSSVTDLGRVTGIGPKKLEELKDLVNVR